MVTIAAHDPPIYKLERHRRAPGQFQSSPERVQDATGFYIYRQMSARVQTTYRIGGAESTTQNSMGQTCDPQGLPNGNPMQRTDESKRTPTSCKSEVSRRTAQRNSSSLSPLKLLMTMRVRRILSQPSIRMLTVDSLAVTTGGER